MKKLFQNKLNVVVAVLILVVLALLVLLFLQASRMALYILVALVVLGVLWIGVDWFLKSRQRRRQKRFDQSLAAKEGIEDRKREWGTWVSELEKQGIDRYQLPFYLLVGEPQSGKSIMLQNSDLHFPFGQTRLSGVGGTRGCDWWFTDEAVILDLAGRLFTHEGGAADELEWQAFLEMLFEFRPLCPANGILLVIPCDGLLQDQRDAVLHKAAKIQNALATLSSKLQAQLPVYLVLTKGDKIFGFAECVHRLEQAQRQQMFGWSRNAPAVDAPFAVEEAREGFEEMVRRSRLLRSEMMATAALPEDMAAVHRMSAFPDELRALWPNLEVYLKVLFTDNVVTERLFFRGLYLTSGLQVGAPIAKVCAELISGSREADARALEALFVKQRAYFIRDLVREKIFAERGLIRPTSSRVQNARRAATIGYAAAGAIALSAIVASVVLATRDQTVEQIEAGRNAILAAWDANQQLPELPTVEETLERLSAIETAHKEDAREGSAVADALGDRRKALRDLHASIVDAQLLPRLRNDAASKLSATLQRRDLSVDFERFSAYAELVKAMTGDLEYELVDGSAKPGTPAHALLGLFTSRDIDVDSLTERLRFRTSTTDRATQSQRESARDLVKFAHTAFDGTIEPGHPWQVGGDLGFVLAMKGLIEARAELERVRGSGANIHRLTDKYAGCLKWAREAGKLLANDGAPNLRVAKSQLAALRSARSELATLAGIESNAEAWSTPIAQLLDSPAAQEYSAATIETYASSDLETVCDPTFLPLEFWDLDQLNATLDTEFSPTGDARFSLRTPAGGIVLAKLVAVGARFEHEVLAWSDLRNKRLFVGAHLVERGEALDEPVAHRTVRLLGGLRRVETQSNLVKPWITHLCGLLETQFQAQRDDTLPSAAKLQDEALWIYYRAMIGAGDADRSTQGLARVARTKLESLLRPLHDELLAQLERQMGNGDERGPGNVEYALGDLLTFEERLQKAFALSNATDELLKIELHRDWLRESVDPLLANDLSIRLRAHEDSVFADLNNLKCPFDELPKKLAPFLAESGFKTWLSELKKMAPPRVTEKELEALEQLLPDSHATLLRLLPFQTNEVARDMANDALVKATASELASFQANDVGDAALAAALAAAIERRNESAKKPSNSLTARRLALEVWHTFERGARAELRTRLHARIDQKIRGQNPLVIEVLTLKAKDLTDDNGRFAQLPGQASAIFNSGGALDQIWSDFRLGTEPLNDLGFDAGEDVRNEVIQSWRVASFLRNVQAFLASREASLDAGQLAVELEWDWDAPNSLLVEPEYRNVMRVRYDYLQKSDGKGKAWLPVPESEDLMAKTSQPKAFRFDWAYFSSRTPLVFHFGLKRGGVSEKDASSITHTLFAPLVLAWSGKAVAPGKWKVELPLKFPPGASESVRAKRVLVTISFPGGNAAVELPEQPLF